MCRLVAALALFTSLASPALAAPPAEDVHPLSMLDLARQWIARAVSVAIQPADRSLDHAPRPPRRIGAVIISGGIQVSDPPADDRPPTRHGVDIDNGG